MKDKPLKASDIAKIAGISESEMKRISETYESVIPSRVLGRVKLYEEKAAKIIENISSMESGGSEPDKIIRELGGKEVKKSTREKIGEKVRRNAGAPKKAAKSSPGKEISEVKRKTTASSGRDENKIAFLELKLTKITNRVETLEKQLEAERAEHMKEREEFKELVAGLLEKTGITDSWVVYFDKKLDELHAEQQTFNISTRKWIDYTDGEIEELKKPFWKRKK